MLEDVKRSYIQKANAVVPNWKDIDVNTLCNLYIENEHNDLKRDAYFSAILLKKWGYIGRHYINSKASGFSIEQCYDMVLDAILYILKKRKWLDPHNKLYGDKNAPDKCLNRCIYSARQRDYYLANRDKRRVNFGKASLHDIMDNIGDHTEILTDQESEFANEDNIIKNLDLKNMISELFKKNKIIEALILDNILNDDCFVTKSDSSEVVVDEETEKVKTYSSNFKLGKLVNNLYCYNLEEIKAICQTYTIKEEILIDYLPILNRDKGKLSRVVKATITNMSKDKKLRASLCC